MRRVQETAYQGTIFPLDFLSLNLGKLFPRYSRTFTHVTLLHFTKYLRVNSMFSL